jgi:alpha-galactosidase
MRIERIDTEHFTLALGLPEQGAPTLVYLGAPLPLDADLAALTALDRDPHWGGLPDDPPPRNSLLPVSGSGFLGAPALSVRNGEGRMRLSWGETLVSAKEFGFSLGVRDQADRLAATWRFGRHTDQRDFVLLEVRGLSPTAPLALEHLAFCLPLPSWADEAITFAGRWAGEWRPQRVPIAVGQRVQEARGGRPGFSAPGFVILCASDTSDAHGPALALHVADGGEPRVMIEGFETGGGQIQLGCRAPNGWPEIDPNPFRSTPHIEFAFSSHGFNGLRAQAKAPSRDAPLKVHLNSWEALYFDYDEARLFALVDAAADLGAERFVLDDGWFKGRRSDKAGLGDWTPDTERFPNGLDPLIAHVKARGLEFGLWIEPEMISPDSDLYRTHPDWALPGPTMRNQCTLNLARREVFDFVETTVRALLSRYDIGYLKWDHNRADFALDTPNTRADDIAILQRDLKRDFPRVVFESCASGGARLHRGHYEWADRFWISDNTDAHARSAMIEAITPFIPLRMIGAHVGASPNPITGRRSDMALRAKIAMFGHMGVEADPAKMTDGERAVLKAHIALYKRLRHLVEAGAFSVGGQSDPGVRAWQLTAPDRGEALALIFRLDESVKPFTPPTPLRGLDPNTDYRLTLLEPWPKAAAALMRKADVWRGRPVLRGALLMQHGVTLPLVHPGTAWLIHLEKAA